MLSRPSPACLAPDRRPAPVPHRPGVVTATQTLVSTPHPTSAFAHDIDTHIADKLQRNRSHRYDTLASARLKHERYIEKRLHFVAGIRRGAWDWGQDRYPPSVQLSRNAIERLHAAFQTGRFDKPTVRQEGERTLRQIESVILAMYRAACGNAPADQSVLATFNGLKTWAGRDNDRSSVVFGDHTHMVAAQVVRCCDVYQDLLDRHGTEHPFFQGETVRGLLSECRDIAARLGALVNVSSDKAALAAFFERSANRLAPHENAIRALCHDHPGDPFATVFCKLGISGFRGEARVNANDLTPPSGRVLEIIEEIRLIHHSLADTASIVIADSSHTDQITGLQALLKEKSLEIEVIPLLESRADVVYFIENIERFKRLGIQTMMLAGSDLARADGTPEAIKLRYLFNQACAEHGFVAYHGIGTSIGRNGTGLSNGSLAQDLLPQLFYAPQAGAVQEVRYTVQGGDAGTVLANPALAREFLEGRLIASPQRGTGGQHAMHLRQVMPIFASITAAERAMRDPDGDFGRLYRACPVMRDLRNASTFHGARDVVKPHLKHAYEDRAINCDASLRLFKIPMTFAWAALTPEDMRAMVRQTRQALRDGNPIVHDTVLNYAVQACVLQSAAACLATWRAAGFSEEHIERVSASRAAMLGFLKDVGWDLSCSQKLQQRVMEYLGIEIAYSADPAANFVAIERRGRRADDALLAALQALRDRADESLPPARRRLAALELHLQLTAAYVLGLGVKS